MCGIIGILGGEPAAPRLVEALKRLEYRGYDSAGIATLEGGRVDRYRAPGKIRNLEAVLAGDEGRIAPKRWEGPPAMVP